MYPDRITMNFSLEYRQHIKKWFTHFADKTFFDNADSFNYYLLPVLSIPLLLSSV